MSVEWLEKVGNLLSQAEGDSSGGFEAAGAFEAAVELDKQLGDRMSAFSESLRGVFEAWVRNRGYMQPPLPLDHQLPETMMRSDIEVQREFGLKTPYSVRDKQAELVACREMRIGTCARNLERGKMPEECVSFIGAKDEWKEANRKSTPPSRGYSPYQGGGEPDAPW